MKELTKRTRVILACMAMVACIGLGAAGGVWYTTSRLERVIAQASPEPPAARQHPPEVQPAREVDPEAAPTPEAAMESNQEPDEVERLGNSLLDVGSYHGDQVPVGSEGTWLGLYVEEGRSELRETEVTVRTAVDPVVDQGSAQTGKDVQVNTKTTPVLLVKDLLLRPGRVRTVAGSADLNAGASIPLSLNGRSYRLEVRTPKKPASEDDGLSTAKLVLVHGAAEQVLVGIEEGDAAHWNLLWAGDMDGDGRLDLYVDASYHYNVGMKRLFLSKSARPGEFVQERARFTTTGC